KTAATACDPDLLPCNIHGYHLSCGAVFDVDIPPANHIVIFHNNMDKAKFCPEKLTGAGYARWPPQDRGR
ncbi:MAG TPA: hypothetical protein DIC41_06875, partial [Alphaproteobacteria bacterium]|nr:hypothetical protein [Alphaproteobacteria bacterium]